MAFFSKGKDDEERKKEEMEELKRQVEGNETRLPEPPQVNRETEDSENAGRVRDKRVELKGNVEGAGLKEPSITLRRESSADERPQKREEHKEESDNLEETRSERKEEHPGKIDRDRGERSREKDDDFAPLFVKIDRYKEVLQKLDKIKNSLSDLQELFSLMNHLDEIKREGMSNLRKGISSLTETLISMDEEFIRPEGTGDFETTQSRSEISRTVGDLQGDLKEIKRSLDRLD